jgi:serine protease Do
MSASFEALAEKVDPSVVQIFASGYAPAQGLVSTADLVAKQRSAGSGVIVDPDGYIITNAHVVRGARRIQILLAARNEQTAGTSILQTSGKLVGAQIVGIDRETDLAVLKSFERGLPALPLGDSDELKPGQVVFAFGSPLGLDNSVTMGIVSATARQLKAEDPMIYIQTDAPINPGNSGGPLVNAQGEVVGINTLIFSMSGGSEGLGFAAPSNIVRNIFDQIRKSGRVRRGEIGVRAKTITPNLARGLDLSREWGVVLSDVRPDGPGAKAGLEIGDVVVTLDGKPMENGRQFLVNLYSREVGETVRLEIERRSEKLNLEVKVVERRNDPDRFAHMVHPDTHLIPQLGILGIDIDQRIAAMLPKLRKPGGVVVAARSLKSSAFSDDGLLPGDVIHEVNRLSVASLAELRAAVARLRSGDPAVVQVERRGELLFLSLEIE